MSTNKRTTKSVKLDGPTYKAVGKLVKLTRQGRQEVMHAAVREYTRHIAETGEITIPVRIKRT